MRVPAEGNEPVTGPRDRRWGLAILVAVGAFLVGYALAGCGESSSAATGDGKLEVAPTVAPITSIVANIRGDHVTITGIVPEGTNSHTFEPKPSSPSCSPQSTWSTSTGSSWRSRRRTSPRTT